MQPNRKILPSNISAAFKHEDYSWITFATCEDYNAKPRSYKYRRMVRPVLISVIIEKYGGIINETLHNLYKRIHKLQAVYTDTQCKQIPKNFPPG